MGHSRNALSVSGVRSLATLWNQTTSLQQQSRRRGLASACHHSCLPWHLLKISCKRASVHPLTFAFSCFRAWMALSRHVEDSRWQALIDSTQDHHVARLQRPKTPNEE